MSPRATHKLRELIERRTCAYLWGKRHFVVPRLVSQVFGDGRKLLGLAPIMFRPNYFVVRIDSRWSMSNWDQQNPMVPHDWLDNVFDSIEEEYVEWPWAKAFGFKWSDDPLVDCNSRIDFSEGCAWWEMPWPRWRKTESTS
jgi:hypothetical protein